MCTDRCGSTRGHKCHAKGSRKKTTVQGFMCRDTTKVEHELYGYTGNNWSHRNGNIRCKENLETVPGKHSTDLLQKTAILGTSHIIRTALQCET